MDAMMTGFTSDVDMKLIDWKGRQLVVYDKTMKKDLT
jgi:hypothetical protein